MKEIQILGRTIQIKTCSKAELLEFDPDSKDVLGWYSPDESTIYIHSGLEGSVYNRVLIHEITHVMLSISGLSHWLEDKQEEAICDLMEGFLELLKNKRLVEYLNG